MAGMQQKIMVAALVGLGALVALNRGGGKKSASAGLAPAAGAIADAVYAGAIPVWRGAQLRDVMGGSYSNDVGGPATHTSKSWFFSIGDPVTKVADYYRTNLPAGWQPSEAEQGAVAFRWIPPAAKDGESVEVTVREGELQITETIKAPSGG